MLVKYMGYKVKSQHDKIVPTLIYCLQVRVLLRYVEETHKYWWPCCVMREEILDMDYILVRLVDKSIVFSL